MSDKYLLCVCCIVVLAGGVMAVAEQPETSEPAAAAHESILVDREKTGPYNEKFAPKIDAVVSGIFEQTNKFRKAEKLEPLTQSETLQKTAQKFADFMARTGKYGHHADDHTPSERVTADGYEICFVGENIAMQFKSDGFATGPLTKGFFQGWKNSPPHRANMLNPAVTETGVAIAQSSDTGAFFAVQLVGRPLSQAVDFQIRNKTSLEIQYQIDQEKFSLPAAYTRRHVLCAPASVQLLQEGKEAPSMKVERGMLYSVTSMGSELKIEKTELPVTDEVQ